MLKNANFLTLFSEGLLVKSVYFREGYHYSFSNLKEKFSLDTEKTKSRISMLKRYYVLKTVRKEKTEYSELSDQDIIVGEIPDDSAEFTYQFTFVGVILFEDLILFCYPKYIDDENDLFSKFKTVIKVLEKYNQKEQLVYLYNGDAESKVFNKLAISLHILKDYFENGLYSNQEEIIELNGNGEILWDKTINETFAFIKNNTPYYLDVYTHDNTENDFDYIRRLHSAIISKCSNDLKNKQLLDLFDLSGAELTEQTLDDFGDVDYIKYRLEREIKNQFVSRKQSLLKTLYTYISEFSSNQSDVFFSLYGTNTFNLVWEKACGAMFENMYDSFWTLERIAETGRISSEFIKGNESKIISDFIEIPEWKINGNPKHYKGDLIPDIVTLRNELSGNTAMYILDGKYYLLSVEGDNLYGNPGIQDVVKQYIYNAALKSFIDTFKIGEIANAFLIPAFDSEDIENQNYGEIPYWTVQHSGFSELPSVQVIKLKPQKVWDCYLGKDKETDSVFNLIQKSPTANYLYHNENDNSIIQINDDKKHFLVGLLKRERLRELSSGVDKSFIFYFYATKYDEKAEKIVRLPMHPYIDSCSEFIGYTSDKKNFIHGELKQVYNRCKIDEMTAEQLGKLLSRKMNNAKTYYVVTVENCSEISAIPYDGLIPNNETLNKLKKENGLNAVLSMHSPKVIDV